VRHGFASRCPEPALGSDSRFFSEWNPSLGSKDASRLHLNATNGKALTLEYLYNLPNSGFQRGCLQRTIYDGCTGCHGRVNVALEGLEKAICVIKQCLAVEDAGVVKNDCKFVGTHGSVHGLI